MFERFTRRAERAVELAEEAADFFGHDLVSTGHLLLGLLEVNDGRAAGVLRSLEVTPEQVRTRVARGESDPEGLGSVIQTRFTPRAGMVLERALREALRLGLNYIDTEHVLLALVRDREGAAVRILLELDMNSESVCEAVINQLPSTVAAYAATLKDPPR